ncbi:zinc finger protein CONSTANS-LIKE 9-like [Amaranthus tricolor]|uniref:zinc finger protein CONSTANS-LIKE 9-like n=1 Tax=Amaranthus tricolor TaxID=29722 RepID=UPI00258294DB|nr:zinc finger protein CONSTANS-LIKE 9-like [Amaranthus tricolor]
MKNMKKGCELCGLPATTYCESDRASLCWHCDGKVHEANFLVIKHIRTLLCHLCQNPTPWTASGPTLPPSLSFCLACASSQSTHLMIMPQHHHHHDGHGHDDGHDKEEERDDSIHVDDDDNQVVPLTSNCSSLPSSSIGSMNNSNTSITTDGVDDDDDDEEEDGEKSVSMIPSSLKCRRKFYMDS